MTRHASLQIELSPSRLAIMRIRRWIRPVRECLVSRELPGASADEALQALASALDEQHCTSMRATVVLGSEWSRLFMATAPRNAESRRDCDAAVQLRNAQLFGDGAEGWAVRADHSASGPFLACAVPDRILEGLQRLSRSHRLTLMSIRPRFLDAWDRWAHRLPPGDWFGVVDADTLTIALLDSGRLADVRRLAVPADALLDPDWPVDAANREALRAGVQAPRQLRLCGPVPAAWLTPDLQAFCVSLDGTRQGAA